MSPGRRTGTWLVAAALISGCARHHSETLQQRFVKGDGGEGDHASQPTDGPDTSLEHLMAQARQMAAAPRPPRSDGARTLEQSDPELSAARARLASAPTAQHQREVAQTYARLGVLDAAYDHFSAAVSLARRDADSYDGRARVWRDWGFPQFGLSDAYRAIYYAPTSPVPRNTLGTLLLKMGLLVEARTAFERALALDPGATYALANVCAMSLRLGDSPRALETCAGKPAHDAVR